MENGDNTQIWFHEQGSSADELSGVTPLEPSLQRSQVGPPYAVLNHSNARFIIKVSDLFSLNLLAGVHRPRSLQHSLFNQTSERAFQCAPGVVLATGDRAKPVN